MELSTIKGHKLVVALDIGTTYSGYAWQQRAVFEDTRNEIHFNTSWGMGALQLHKTTTCILLECNENVVGNVDKNKDGTKLTYNDKFVVKIGQEAERAYIGLAKKKQDPKQPAIQYHFFSRFKLLLYDEKFHPEQQIEDQEGLQFPLFNIMSLLIKGLKNHFIENSEMRRESIDLNKTLFVVTVPAIWSEKAKKFMRDAAIEAGIGKRNLLLALEPEAAAVFCIHLPEGQKKEMNDLGMKGQKFLVADLGGGTADLSAVKVEDTGLLSEICPPLGDRVGGQKINEAFLQVCHDNFEGNEWRKIFSEVNPVEILKMEADFEQKKVTIGSTDPNTEYVDLRIPPYVRCKLEDETIKLKVNSYIKFEDGELFFNSTTIRDKLFKEACEIVYKTIAKVLNRKEAEGLKTVVLVGGFSESPIVVRNLRHMIGKDFPDVKVVVPSSPFKAVLKGAVLFGQDPMIFRSRICRETLGIGTNSKFDEKVHTEDRKWKNDETGQYWCKDVFSVHVRMGQSVVLNNKQPMKRYFPLYKNQKQLDLQIYSSTSPNPKYVTDDGCKMIGKITVDLPDTTGGTDREAEVTMVYGGTELSVIAKDKASGKEYNADISFSSL